MKNYAMMTAIVAMSLGVAHGDVMYVDASPANTLEWNGSDFSTWNPGSVAADGEWRARSFGNDGTIYESAFTTDTTRLKTTVSGLDYATYDVYAYMWAAQTGNNWQMGASLTNDVSSSNLTLYAQYDYPTNAALSVPYVEYSEAIWGDFTPVDAVYSTDLTANPFGFNAVMVAESDRRLMEIYLGQVTGTEISVFIDDKSTAPSGSNRTWYDGIGYVKKVFQNTEPDILTFEVSGGAASLSWISEDGALYNIMHKTDMDDAEWVEVKTNIIGQGATTTNSVPVSGTEQEFFIVSRQIDL